MSQRMHYNAASPAGMKALGAVYGYVRQSGLPSRLVDLMCLRVSQITGCAYCIDMHSRDVLKAGLPGRAPPPDRPAVREHVSKNCRSSDAAAEERI
jgi:AhpD family alkylhydroperoxidase